MKGAHKLSRAVFRVPNDEKGKAFIANLHEYLNPSFKIRIRGRAENRKARGFSRDSVPISKADWLSVYCDASRELIKYLFDVHWEIVDKKKELKLAEEKLSRLQRAGVSAEAIARLKD
jgi:hypothetical protein